MQGTAEGLPFTLGELDQLIELATAGIGEIVQVQKTALAEPPPSRSAG